MKQKLKLQPKHPFFTDRVMAAAYIVCRVDDYGVIANQRGGFGPGQGQYMGKGGMLWPTEELATKAAQWVINQPEHKGQERAYGVFKLVAIVEESTPIAPPTIVTKVA